MATHSSTPAWQIPWREEPGRLQSLGSPGVGHDWATSLSLFTFHTLEKETATHSSVLAWRIPGTGEPGGLPSMGSHRVGHDWSDLAAAKWHPCVRQTTKYLLNPCFIAAGNLNGTLTWTHIFINKAVIVHLSSQIKLPETESKKIHLTSVQKHLEFNLLFFFKKH